MSHRADKIDGLILQDSDPTEIPTIVAVRGIARGVGTTSLAANLALKLANLDNRVLMLDLSLWNCDLTRAFGYSPEPALIELAKQLEAGSNLSIESVNPWIKPCRPNLDLLPGAEHWLESFALQAENGWNFIQNLLVAAQTRWGLVVADLGSHTSTGEQRDNTFLPWCAVHAAILRASSVIVGVCDSIDYLKLWQHSIGSDLKLKAKTIYVVNQHRSNLPLGLDRFQLEPGMRAQSRFIPPLHEGLAEDPGGLFFIERVSTSGESRQALHELEGIVDRVSRHNSAREELR